MKNTIKAKLNRDAIAEARGLKSFQRYSRDTRIKIRLAVEVYSTRESKKLSQQELAKLARTTQKVISKIENSDVNIGIDLLNRLGESLGFALENWSRIFDSKMPEAKVHLIYIERNEPAWFRVGR